jgi:hypothetical protein
VGMSIAIIESQSISSLQENLTLVEFITYRNVKKKLNEMKIGK